MHVVACLGKLASNAASELPMGVTLGSEQRVSMMKMQRRLNKESDAVALLPMCYLLAFFGFVWFLISLFFTW